MHCIVSIKSLVNEVNFCGYLRYLRLVSFEFKPWFISRKYLFYFYVKFYGEIVPQCYAALSMLRICRH